jgi:hypothetical protein
MGSIICAFRSELKENIQHKMKAVIGWADRLQRSDRDWTQSRNDAVHSGASGDPQGRRRSDVGRRTKEAA